MTSARTYNSTIAGVVVHTTHLYSKWLNFDRIVKYIVEAANFTPEADENGVKRYRYTSAVKTTNPYRVLQYDSIAFVPSQWIYVTDYPIGGHSGLITASFVNYHLIENEIFSFDKDTGMMFQELAPNGYRKR